MGSGGVAIAALPTVICLKVPFSDGLGEVLPNFDRERVYVADIKKLISWYNILISNGITEFKSEPEAEEEVATDEK